MSRLLFLRHGETEWNERRLLQGQADLPLSAAGRRQAEAIAGFAADYRPDLAVCSDLRRARETAAVVGFAAARPDPAWREADLGEWTGASIPALRAERPEDYRAWREARLSPPGGETWGQLRARIERALQSLIPLACTVLVVTHGGVVRAACEILLGLGPKNLLPVNPASLTVIDVGRRPRLRAYNAMPVVGELDPPE
jgi:glucosyl-3-phosphoglycerate phosphatase